MMYFIGSFEYRVTFLVKIRRFNGTGSGLFALLGSGSWANFQADRLYKSNDTYQYKCGGVRAYKKGKRSCFPLLSVTQKRLSLI